MGMRSFVVDVIAATGQRIAVSVRYETREMAEQQLREMLESHARGARGQVRLVHRYPHIFRHCRTPQWIGQACPECGHKLTFADARRVADSQQKLF